MVAVAGDVLAVSESQLHWSNALASTRMVQFVVAQLSLSQFTGF